MKGLIKFELINIFRSVSFLVCGIILACLSVSNVFMTWLGSRLLDGYDMSYILGLGLDGEHFLVTAPANSNYVLLIGIVICIFVCSGYSQKTYRNIWSRGFSRGQVYASKLLATSLVAFVYAVLSMIISFVTASLLFGVGDDWDSTSYVVTILVVFMCVGVAVAFTAMAFICKNMGLSIVIAVMCPSLLTIGSTIIDVILEYKEIEFRTSKIVLTTVMQNIAMKPYDSTVITEAIVCLLMYLVVFTAGGYFGMKKDEI